MHVIAPVEDFEDGGGRGQQPEATTKRKSLARKGKKTFFILPTLYDKSKCCLSESYKRAIQSQLVRTSSMLLKRQKSCDGADNVRKCRRKNVITAKLGFVFLLIFITCGMLMHFGYSHIPHRWQGKLNLRAFVHAVALDGIICVLSPVLLLYGSQELRKSVKQKLFRKAT